MRYILVFLAASYITACNQEVLVTKSDAGEQWWNCTRATALP